eukprot:3305732-Lingulodinium_polyedra.AAC.1
MRAGAGLPPRRPPSDNLEAELTKSEDELRRWPQGPDSAWRLDVGAAAAREQDWPPLVKPEALEQLEALRQLESE